MPTPSDQQIEAGIFENAKLEVAKKLKALVGKLREKGKLPPNYKEPEPEEYLQMADDAIMKRKLSIPGIEDIKEVQAAVKAKLIKDPKNITLEELDKAFKMLEPEEYKNLNGTIPEIVPTEDHLKQVSGVAIRSVQKATGPLTVMGTSLFTLITSFFQAIGDLFSGKIDGGIGGFFGHVKKLAAENTGQAIGDNLDSGLNALRNQNPAIAKWLTPKMIRDSVDSAKQQALVQAGVAPRGKDAKAVLKEMDAGKEYEQFTLATVEAKILQGVEKDLFDVTQKTLGTDGKATLFTMGKQLLGFAARPEQAQAVTKKVSEAVTKVITDPNYKYDGPIDSLKGKTLNNLSKEQLSDIIKYETEKALKASNGSAGFFGYKLSEDEISKIAGQIPTYVDKNYDSLMQMGRRLQGQSNQPSTPGAGVVIKKERSASVSEAQEGQIREMLSTRINTPAVEKKLRENLEAKIRELKPDFTLKENDPFITEAKKKFAEIGAKVVAANPRLLEKGQEAALAKAISDAMAEDKDFSAAVKAKLKEYGIEGEMADAAMPMLTDMIAPELTTVLDDQALNASLVGIVTDKVIQDDKVANKDTPASGSVPPLGTGQPAAVDPIKLVKLGVSDSLKKGFADGTPANTMLEMLTGLDKLKPEQKEVQKKAKLGTLTDAIAETSGLVSTAAAPDGMFEIKGGKPFFKNQSIGESPDEAKKAFKEAKDKIAANLIAKNPLAITDPDPKVAEAVYRGIAESAALELVNKSLESQKKPIFDKKAPEFTTDQVKATTLGIQGMIKKGLSEPDTKQMINLAALGANITEEQLDAISKASAQSMAKLLTSGEKDPAKIKETLTKDLEASGTIPDPRMLKPIVETIEKKYTATMGDGSGKPVAVDPQREAMERVEARAKAVGQVKSTVSDMVNKAVYDFGEKARAKINEQPLYVDETKWIRGTKWFAKMIKNRQHDAMHTLVDGSVQLAKDSVDQEKLKQLITDSAVAATEKKYKGREFYQLSEQEKKDAIAEQVNERLQNDVTYSSIFPTAIGFRGVGIPLGPGLKQIVISEVVDSINKKMNFVPAPDLPKTTQPDMQLGALVPTGPNFGQGQATALG